MDSNLPEFAQEVMGWAAILGPNKYLQAVGLALVFILIGKFADLLISKIVVKLVSRSKTEFDDALIKMLARPIFVTIVLIGLAGATRVMDMGETPQFITLGIIRTIAIVVWYQFFSAVLTMVLSAISRRSAMSVQASMTTLFSNVLKVILLALAVYFFFLAWDINVSAWIASAGIVGLALSFAARDTLSNLFAGVSIVADAPYKTGDFIILESGERGKVTNIGLRSTRILTRDDVEITIPNGVLGNTKIINEAGGPSAKHRIRVKVGVAYGSDIDQVIEALNGVAIDHTEICKAPEPRVRFRQFGDSSLDFELLCWIDRPVDRGRLSHELNCAVYKAFKEEKIEIPFPQRDLHVRTMVPVPD